MSKKTTTTAPLLTMRNVHIKGLSDETWVDIINGVDLDLRRGEVLGLIGDLTGLTCSARAGSNCASCGAAASPMLPSPQLPVSILRTVLSTSSARLR